LLAIHEPHATEAERAICVRDPVQGDDADALVADRDAVAVEQLHSARDAFAVHDTPVAAPAIIEKQHVILVHDRRVDPGDARVVEDQVALV
jgi:hypothetical protein